MSERSKEIKAEVKRKEAAKLAAMTPEQRKAHDRRMMIGGFVVIAVIIAAVVWSFAKGDGKPATPVLFTPTTFTMSGAMELGNDNFTVERDLSCAGKGGYDDLRNGAGVTLYDAAGRIVGAGALSGAHAVPGTFTCYFTFSVPAVPAGVGPYQYEISHRGRLTVTEADAKAGPTATIG